MDIGNIIEDHETQAVRLPADTRFPDHVKQVAPQVVGNSRVAEPLHSTWDSFFHPSDAGVTDDFMEERASGHQPERESF